MKVYLRMESMPLMEDNYVLRFDIELLPEEEKLQGEITQEMHLNLFEQYGSQKIW